MTVKIKKYKIAKLNATKGDLKFYGDFYRCKDADNKFCLLTSKISQLEAKRTKENKQKPSKEPTVRAFKEYVLSGGCASRNVRFYLINLIDAFIMREK